MRYAHSGGHTFVCYDDSGELMLTCGSDGDLRVWKGIDDDDSQSITAGDKIYRAAMKNGKVFAAASDHNTVQAYSFPEGNPDGILTRFTAPVTDFCFNESGTLLLAGSCDFEIRLTVVADSSQKLFQGHEAPVLSVALSHNEKYIASSSCDGTVRVWKVEDQTCLKSWPILTKCSDISLSETLCRLEWQPNTRKYLAVPVGGEVRLYEMDSWKESLTLKGDGDTSSGVVTAVAWSPTGTHLAAATVGGHVLVWDINTKQCADRFKHEQSYTICALAWNPKDASQIAYTDNQGQLGVAEKILLAKSTGSIQSSNVTAPANDNLQYSTDMFEGDDMDDADLLAAVESAQAAELGDVDDFDDEEVPPVVKRHKRIIVDDENSHDGTMSKAGDDDKSSIITSVTDQASSSRAPATLYAGPMPTPLQKPFQPASTPVHLSSRFMVWNSVGVIQAYNLEDDNSIDIQFHDSSTHHPLHLDNNSNYTMADLSPEAVLLGAPGGQDDNRPSQLFCLHFGSWDNQKEWSTTLPKGEDIKAMALGMGWCAVATNKRLVRLFTTGGVQREMFSIPGPVVSMAAHGSQLMVIYHMGTGMPGDQLLGVKLKQVDGQPRQIIEGESLPLSPKSTLTWLGFTAEGTPATADSEGQVRFWDRSLLSWVPVANTKSHSKNRSDNFWIVGAHENPQQLRCILCKGSTFPATLPKPNVTILPFKMPLCEMETEKSQYEETYLRTRLFSNFFGYLKEQNYEVDESAKEHTEKEAQNVCMKQFALACKSDRECRAAEVCQLMMTSNEVQLAIKYAGRLKRLALAQQLTDLALAKMEEEENAAAAAATSADQSRPGYQQEDPLYTDDFDMAYSKTETEWATKSHYGVGYKRKQLPAEESQEREGEDEEMEEEGDDEPKMDNPLLKNKKAVARNTESALPSKQEKKNPFKVNANSKQAHSPALKGGSVLVFDNMSKKSKRSSSPVKNKKNQQQTKLTKERLQKTKKVDKPASEQQGGKSSPPNKPTAFNLWCEEARTQVREEHGDLEEEEITKILIQQWREMPKENKQVWTEKVNTLMESTDSENKKRKHSIVNADNDVKLSGQKRTKALNSERPSGKRPLSTTTNAKLSSFLFKKTPK